MTVTNIYIVYLMVANFYMTVMDAYMSVTFKYTLLKTVI